MESYEELIMESYDELLFATKVQFTRATLLNVFTTPISYNINLFNPRKTLVESDFRLIGN